MRAFVVAIAALALAPGASAWTTLAAGLQDTVVPSAIVTQTGTELVSFDSPPGDTISVSRNRSAPRVVVTGDLSAGRTQLVQQPNGAIQLYFPNAQGVARLTSTDDGQTWTGPLQTQSPHTAGGVVAAAVAPDGTPYFAQDGTGFVDVFRGLDGETEMNVFPRCCGHAESLVVDTAGLVQIAFFSDADPDGAFLHYRLASDLSVAGFTSLKPTAATDRVPLIADRSGFTFLVWAPGRPPTGVTVVPFREGQPAGDGVYFPVAFGDVTPHMALATDGRDRLWAIWTNGDRVSVARSRSHGEHFGAVVTTRTPADVAGISATALAGEPGSLDVVVNTGSTLIEQQLRPGLSVHIERKMKNKVVTRWVQALDDKIPVPAATFRIGGRTIRANTQGRAKVPPGSGKAAAPGYAVAPFRVR